MGITKDKRLSFREHIQQATDKCRKLIFALSRSAKLNCGLSHAVLNTLYMGGILHHLYGALVWTETVEKASYRKMLSRVQN